MQQPKSKKESVFSRVHGYEFKEEEGNLIVKGYIATTHLDSGFFDEGHNAFVRDKIAKETLESWRDEINSGNPRTNKVSINHDRETHVTGVGVKGTARVDELPDGELGLYVETLVDKTKDNFGDTSYRIEHDLLDSFSIEFTTRDIITGDYTPNTAIEERIGDGVVRTLMPGTQLEGWTLASQPMNEHAVMLKEVKKQQNKIQTRTDSQHKEGSEPINFKSTVENTEVDLQEKTNHTHKNEKLNKENFMEENKMETKEEVTPEAPVEEKPAEAPVVETPEAVITEEEKELIKLGRELKEKRLTEAKEKETLEIKESIKKDLKEELNKIEVEEKVKENIPTENKELLEFKEAIKSDSKVSINAQFAMAGKMADMAGLTVGGIRWDTRSAEQRQYKNFATNGKLLEYKGLGLTTNQNSDTDYLLSAAELSDVFDPVIFNVLNQETVTWNILDKEDFSNKGNNQVQFALKIAANTTAAAYTGNAVSLGNVTRQKYMTKFKKYAVGVEVDGDMIAAARGGPIGDVFSKEVMDSTDDLMAAMNVDLFAEVGAETEAGVIGFEYITDQAGNTTLYNVTRSQANGLSSTTTADNYINGSSADISLSNLRAAKRKALKEGAKIGNLVFVTDHIQGDKFRGIYDAAQRLVPTSSRFGFEGRPEFDGIPIFEDKDCNDDDWFLVDLETHKIAVWVPPTLEMLGKDADSQKGFIKTYFATYNKAPRRMVQIYANAT